MDWMKTGGRKQVRRKQVGRKVGLPRWHTTKPTEMGARSPPLRLWENVSPDTCVSWNLGPLISNIFSLQICFSFQYEWFEFGSVYFTPRFNFLNFMFQILILRNSFWVHLNFRISKTFFSFPILIHLKIFLVTILHPSPSNRLTIYNFKSIPIP